MAHTVTFRLTYADLKHLDMHGRFWLSVLTWTGAILITGAITFGLWRSERAFFDRVIDFPPAVQFPLIYATVFTVLFFPARLRLRLAQKPALAETHTVTITDDSFTLSNSRGTHSLPWSTLRQTTSDSNGIYITTTSGERLIIPYHAFETQDHFDTMFQTIRELICNNRNARV